MSHHAFRAVVDLPVKCWVGAGQVGEAVMKVHLYM